MLSRHVSNQSGRLFDPNPDRGDIERPSRRPPVDRDRVGGGAEGGLGHPNNRYGDLCVKVGAQTGSSVGVEVDVAVDDKQIHIAGVGHHRTDGRKLPGKEPTGLVRGDVVQPGDVLTDERGEPRLG